jgi:hypothetical protein
MSDSAETYKLLETDAANWLETAEGLQMSAKLSWDALWALSRVPPSESRQSRLAYMQSFMLLTAFAFENVCRGVATLTKAEGWKYLANYRGGHDLSSVVSEFVSISAEERDLLQRLETYSRWAGRYLIPKGPDQYVKAVELQLRTVRPADLELAEQLFERLKAQLQRGLTNGS